MKSIRTKIWFSTTLLIVLFIFFIWLMQIAFLPQYYEMEKTRSILGSAAKIEMVLQKASAEDAQNQLEQIAYEGNLCMDVRTLNGISLFYIDMIGEDCIIHSRFGTGNGTAMQLLQLYNAEGKKQMIRTVSSNRFDIKSLVMIKEIKDSANNNYLLFVNSPLEPVKATSDILEKQIILLSAVLLFVGTIIAFFMSSYMTRSIGAISNAAKSIGEGNFEARVYVSSDDEIGELAKNFNFMAEEINKVESTRRDLMANVSHDLRTPLTMIKGYAETIKDITGDDKAKRSQQLDIIIAESDRLNNLVDDMLSLSRMQSHDIVIQPQPFDLAVMIQDIIERYQLNKDEDDYDIRYAGPDECKVMGDSRRIEQVIYNLLNNAINHIGKDKQVVITAQMFKHKCKVMVEDHGDGIASQHLPLIWDRYYRVNKSGKRQKSGTGLGLSIVKAILIAHKANYGVNSTEGKGSIFWFELPVVK
jgi:signal transduction histidine kinase